MRDFKVHQSEGDEMVFDGMLTIENAAAIRDILLEGLERRERIKITVSDDAVADLSFLQVLCSVCRTALGAEKSVTQGSFSAAFVSTILDAGFARSRGCTAGEENNCLWTMGGKK